MAKDIKSIIKQLVIETQGFSAEQLLKWALGRFGNRIALATSLGAEDQVLTDMLCRTNKDIRIFTLDTGRLPEETYELIEITRKKYGIRIDILFPAFTQVEETVNKYGPNLFYQSTDARKLCCRIRKVEPLRRQLTELDAWICGLRSGQAVSRRELQPIEWDDTFGLVKICPLANWSTEQVWNYIKKNSVPYNKLHEQGYTSIGCKPCTRAVKPGEDIRAGRWWWEKPEHKECGLHLNTVKIKNNQEMQK